MPANTRSRRAIAAAAALAVSAPALAQTGLLTPPAGSPASTGKPLEQLEPRRAVVPPNLPFVDQTLAQSLTGSLYLTRSVRFDSPFNSFVGFRLNERTTLDLMDFLAEYTGTETGTTAVLTGSGQARGALKNGRLVGWDTAVVLAEASTIRDVAIEDCATDGIRIFQSSTPDLPPTIIENVTIDDVAGTAINIITGDAIIRNVTITDANVGIFVSGDAVLENVTVRDTVSAIRVFGTCQAENVTITDASSTGMEVGENSHLRSVVVDGADNCVVPDRGTLIESSVLTGFSSSAVVNTALFARGVVIRDTNMESTLSGTAVNVSNGFVLDGCTITTSGDGAAIRAENNLVIRDCDIQTTGAGVVAESAAVVERSTFTFNNSSLKNGLTLGENATVRSSSFRQAVGATGPLTHIRLVESADRGSTVSDCDFTIEYFNTIGIVSDQDGTTIDSNRFQGSNLGAGGFSPVQFGVSIGGAVRCQVTRNIFNNLFLPVADSNPSGSNRVGPFNDFASPWANFDND